MSTTHHKLKNQAGVSVITAIFLVVILALMGVGMVSILTTSQQSISQEITSAKAYMAGRSCLQWEMYQSIYDADPWVNQPHTLTFNNNGLINTECTNTFTVITNDGHTFLTLILQQLLVPQQIQNSASVNYIYNLYQTHK